MALHVGVQIRMWPWSTAKEEIVIPDDNRTFPYFGSPLFVVADDIKFVLPKRNEQFIPLGSSFPSLQGQYRLYEMPHGILSEHENSYISNVHQNITLFHANHMQSMKLNATHALSPLHNQDPSELAQVVMAWSQFFDDCIDSKKHVNYDNQLPWHDFCRYLSRLTGEMSEPHMALIVHIAEKMRRRIEPAVRMARKILIRERTLLPIDRIAETDTSCLRWYIRQPGETMAQKAAMHRQSLMGITRKESYDTLENRVLKDFLIRCKAAAQKYIAVEVGKKFQQSSRGRSVRQYQNICTQLLMDTVLNNVSSLLYRVKPNYVLQNDIRYKEIWEYYKRLLRQEDEEDRSWDWQTRTWADIVRLLIGATFSSSEDNNSNGITPFAKAILQASIFIRKEQRLGSRVVPGSEPGPFVLSLNKNLGKNKWIMDIVHADEAYAHIATHGLERTGAHLYLALERIGTHERRVIIIWAVHTASSSYPANWDAVSLSAQRSLMQHESILSEYQIGFPQLSGIVMASTLHDHKIDVHQASGGAPVFIIPADPRMWAAELDNLAYLLQAYLEEAIHD
jgi:hypothetical protein